METTDYRTLLAEALWPSDANDDDMTTEAQAAADDILATRIPDLCPDCGGDELMCDPFEGGMAVLCAHPNAPTIGDRLALADRADELLPSSLAAREDPFPWSWHDETIKPDDPMAAYWLGADRMLVFVRKTLRTEADR